MVETFTSWFNALAISAVDIAKKITTALHGIGLAAVGMAELLVRAGDPFQLWTKGILAGLEKQRAIYKASYTEQMNALDALSAKMLKAIENQSRLNALGLQGRSSLLARVVALQRPLRTLAGRRKSLSRPLAASIRRGRSRLSGCGHLLTVGRLSLGS